MVGIAGAETHKTNYVASTCYACGKEIGGMATYGKKQSECSYSAMAVKGIGLVQFCSKECHENLSDL